MEAVSGGCLCGDVRLVATGRPYRVGLPLPRLPQAPRRPVLRRRDLSTRCLRASEDEIEVHLGALDAPDQLLPTYQNWTVRRESWLPPFPLAKHHARNRLGTGRSEDAPA